MNPWEDEDFEDIPDWRTAMAREKAWSEDSTQRQAEKLVLWWAAQGTPRTLSRVERSPLWPPHQGFVFFWTDEARASHPEIKPPRLYGFAWECYVCRVQIWLPIPLNWIARWIRRCAPGRFETSHLLDVSA